MTLRPGLRSLVPYPARLYAIARIPAVAADSSQSVHELAWPGVPWWKTIALSELIPLSAISNSRPSLSLN